MPLGSRQGLVDSPEIAGSLLITDVICPKLGSIRQVEKLGTELEPVSLIDWDVFEKREIQIGSPGTIVTIVPQITVRTGRRARYGSDVKPLVRSSSS